MAIPASPGAQVPQLSEGAQFAMDYMGTMGSPLPDNEVAAVLDLTENGITLLEERLTVLGRLGELAVGNQAVQEALERARALNLGGSKEAEVVPDDEVMRRLESRGYVSEAPNIIDQMADESREGVGFMYDGQSFSDAPKDRGRDPRPMTELRGIRDLYDFVSGFISKTTGRANQAGFGAARRAAKSIKKNLTYIGRKERDKGTSDLGVYLGEHLLSDDENQLCIMTGSSIASITGEARELGLSDDVIWNEIRDSMRRRGVPDSVLRRIITDPRQLSGDSAKWKVAFVDDWVVSGRQMRTKIKRAKRLIASEYHSAIEIDVVAAPPHIIARGLEVEGVAVPVKASYRAHAAAAEDSEGVGCHITGTDATVNFGFGVQIERMQKLLNEIRGRGQPEVPVPAVASVYRAYWDRLKRAGPRRR